MIENTDRTMNLHHASLAIKESKGMLEAGRREGGGTVLPNGVKVAVWDLSQIGLSCTLHSYLMNLVQKWTSE